MGILILVRLHLYIEMYPGENFCWYSYDSIQITATHLNIGSQKINLLEGNLQKSCSDLYKKIGYQYSSLHNGCHGDMLNW